MVEDRKKHAAELRAQARRCRSLASGLVPGADRNCLNDLAHALDAEADADRAAEAAAARNEVPHAAGHWARQQMAAE